MILLLKYLNKLLRERVGLEYKDMSEEKKRALGTVTISGVKIAKPLYDAWMEYIPENEVTNFIMRNRKCVDVINDLFYKDSVFSMPYMGKIGKDFNVLFIGTFNLKIGSMTYKIISGFINPFSKFISSRRPSSSSRNAPFDVGFVIGNLCNSLLPSQVIKDLYRVFLYMKKCPREGNEDLYELWDELLSLLKTMNQASELVHKNLLKVLLEQIKVNTSSKKAVNCSYEFFSEKANGIFNDASSISTAVEKVQGGSIPIGKTHHLCSGGLGSGNKSKDAMEQARDTVTMMMQVGMNIDHQREYTTQDTKSILEVENDAGIIWMDTFCSKLKFESETDEQYRATVTQRKLENKQRKEMLGAATSNGRTVADRPVYYGYSSKDIVKGKGFPSKSLREMPAFLREEHPDKFPKSKTNQQIKKQVIDAINHGERICRDGPFASYTNGGLEDVLEKEAEKQAQKKGNDKAKAKTAKKAQKKGNDKAKAKTAKKAQKKGNGKVKPKTGKNAQKKGKGKAK